MSAAAKKALKALNDQAYAAVRALTAAGEHEFAAHARQIATETDTLFEELSGKMAAKECPVANPTAPQNKEQVA